MRSNIVRKILVALIIIAPAVSYTGCKKQAKCGCGKDVISTLTNASVNVIFNDTHSILYFQPVGNLYAQYNFCNPSEIIPKLADVKSGDIMLVSGHVYWNCNYVSQASNSPQQSYFKIYDCDATDLTINLYGKK
jgi:hypothetical protein